MSETAEVAMAVWTIIASALAGLGWRLRGTLQEKLGHAERRLVASWNDSETLRARLETADRRGVRLSDEVAHQRERARNAEKARDAAIAEAAALKKELTGAKEGIARRDQAGERLVGELMAAQAERDALAAAANRLSSQVQGSATRLSEVQQERDALTAQRDFAHGAWQEAERQRAAVTQERDAWLTEASNLQEALDAANARLAELAQEAAELKERNERQAFVILGHADNASADKRDLEDLAAQLASAHDMNSIVHNRATAAEEELAERARTIDRLAHELRTLREERDRLGRMAGAALGMGTPVVIENQTGTVWRDVRRN